MTNIAELLVLLQELELASTELDELTDALTTDGLSESVRRKVQAVLVRESTKRFPKLQALEQAEDLLKTRDAKIETLTKTAKQSINRITMQTKAAFESIDRKVKEDKEATTAGATLLLHTDDVVAPLPTHAESDAPSDAVKPRAADLTPKQAAATAIAAAKAPSVAIAASQPTAPASPSLPQIPTDQPLPPTIAPLPPTPIAPPAMTEPTAA